MGDCEKCGAAAVVGLNGRFLCLDCFESSMADVGEQAKKIRAALHDQVPALTGAQPALRRKVDG